MPRKKSNRSTQSSRSTPASAVQSSSSGLSYDHVSEGAYFSSTNNGRQPAAFEPQPVTVTHGSRNNQRQHDNNSQVDEIRYYQGQHPVAKSFHVTADANAKQPSSSGAYKNPQHQRHAKEATEPVVMGATSTRKKQEVHAYPRSQRKSQSTANAGSSSDFRNSYSNDDDDLIAHKSPRGRPQPHMLKQSSPAPLRYPSSKNSFNNTSSPRPSTSDRDLVREKLPVGRPTNFQPVQQPQPKRKPVKATQAEIVPDPTTDEPLHWEKARAFAVPTMPVAQLAEPSSVGRLLELSSRGEGLAISAGHVLPAGASSYHNEHHALHQLDPPTRAVEASVLSYCTLPSYESYDVVAQRVGTTNHVSVSPQKPPENSDSHSEAEKKSTHRKHKNSSGSSSSKQVYKLQIADDLQQAHTIDGQPQPVNLRLQSVSNGKSPKVKGRNPGGRQFSKIQEAERENEHGDNDATQTTAQESLSTTVAHRNSRPVVRQVPPARASVEPARETTRKKKCCLWALFGV